jgi:hypothetical protein
MAERYYGVPFDGVLAMDPTALARILSVIGPVKGPDGTTLTGDNLVETLDVGVYQRFNDDSDARKAFFGSVAEDVVNAVLHRSVNSAAMLHVLGNAAGEHRLVAYSADPTEEQQLATTPLGGILATTRNPFAEVVVNSNSGTKLDEYLQRSVTYQRASCSAGPATVTVTLHNDAPTTGLPSYMTTGIGWSRRHTAGSLGLLVGLYGTYDSSIDTVTLDGHQVFVIGGIDQGRPVTQMSVAINPGQTRTVVFKVLEPKAAGPVVVPVQPLVQGEHVTVAAPRCDG